MSAHNIMPANAPSPLVFAARLTPYRSLSPRGFRILIWAVGIVCFTIGIAFFAAGVWPVLGFMGLDFLLIYWAFKANYKSARAYEDVEISRQHVLLRKVSPNGKSRDFEFQQFGTRFEVERHDEIGITKMRLANRKREVEFGYFLNPADRETFANTFSRAMVTAKQ